MDKYMNDRDEWAHELMRQSDEGELVKKISSLELKWMRAFIEWGEGIPIPEYEYAWDPSDADKPAVHKSRLDFAWPDYRVYVECDGGFWTSGGHNQGANALKNLKRQNTLASLGWMPLRFVAGMEISKDAQEFFDTLRKTLEENQCLIRQRDNVPSTIREILERRPSILQQHGS
jgi:hypothetical protein